MSLYYLRSDCVASRQPVIGGFGTDLPPDETQALVWTRGALPRAPQPSDHPGQQTDLASSARALQGQDVGDILQVGRRGNSYL